MRILVARKSGGLGDIICCEPVIRGLRKRYSHDEIIFGMPKEFVPLFEGRSEVTFKGFSPVKFTDHWMRKYWEQYDIVLDLCGPEVGDEKHGSPDCSRTESFCSYAGVESSCPQIIIHDAERQTAQDELSAYPQPWIGLGPNGKKWTKNWPPERWGELVKELPGTAFYFDVKQEPKFEGTVPVIGRSLREVAALISQLDMMIAVDTGLLHLTGATGVKSFSIWGPTDPHRTLKHYSEAYYLDPEEYRKTVGCNKPCLNAPSPCLNESLYFSKCMENIPTTDVVRGVKGLLAGDKPRKEVAKAVSYATKKTGMPEKGDRPRIVWVSKHLLPMVGGAERSAVEMLKHLGERDYDVLTFWSHHLGGPFEHYDSHTENNIFWAQTPPGALTSKMLEAEPDVVLTQLSIAPHIAKVVPKVVPLILFLRSVSEHFCQRINSGECEDGTPIDLLNCHGCDDEAFKSMEATYKMADEVVANSGIMAAIFEKFTGRKAHVQYPVVDGGRCESDKTSKRYCVVVGVTENRGRSFLGQLARAMPNENFMWVGMEGTAPPNVEIVERAENLGEIFSKAFLNLTPHRQFQAFGRTPVEAGWAGIPTLTLNSGGLPEAVGDGGLVLDEAVGDWQEAISELRRDRQRWQRLSDAAREHAGSFNWDTLDRLLDSYCPKPEYRPQKVLSAPEKHRNGGGRRVLLVSHNNLLHKTRGGEKSMLRIMEYLRDFGYNCHIVMPRRIGEDSTVDFDITRVDADHRSESWTGGAKANVAEVFDSFKPDVVLTWSSPSNLVKELCTERNIPYVLFVRTLPKIEQLHSHGCLDSASAIITNCRYTSDLLKTEFSLESVYSYVPSFVPKIAKKSSREYLTIIGAEKARKFLDEIAPEMQDQEFLVVDYSIKKPFQRYNMHHVPYQNDMTDIWSRTDILLFPASEDMSGTSHTTMEAMIQGIPAIVQDRTSLAELNFLTVPKDAGLAEWKTEVEKVQADWQSYSDRARQFAFENHDPRREMERVRQTVENVMPSKGRTLIWLEEGVGNIVESLPTVEAIRSMGYEVDAVVAPTTADTVNLVSLQPYIENVFSDNSRLLRDRRAQLAEEMPDLNQYDVLSSCHRSHGFAGVPNVIRRTSSPHDKPEREWHMAIARKLGYNGDTPKAMLFCERKWGCLPQNAVAFVPGAVTKGWILKRWDGYEDLAEYFDAVVLFGHECDVLPKRRAWMSRTANLVGQLSLSETATVLSQCGMFIGHDSGLAHVAAALGIPTFVIFGPTSHVKNLPEGAVLIRKRPPESCQPCQYTPKFLKCHDRRCLKELTASDVFAQVNDCLQITGGPDASV